MCNLLPMMTPLQGCATDGADVQPVTQAPAIICPRPLVYDPQFEKQWGDDVAATPPGSTFRKVTRDYITERDKLKACNANARN